MTVVMNMLGRQQAQDNTDMPGDSGRGVVTDRSTLTLAFSRFGWRAVESAADDLGESLEDFLAYACGFYVRELDLGRARVEDVELRSRSGQDREVEIAVPTRIWQRIQKLATRRDVSAAEVVEHAALALATEVASGAAAERLFELDDEDD